MRRLSTGAAAALFALVAPIAVRATTFTEIGDAGALPASANVVDVVDPTRIDGRIEDGADADLFALTLTAGVPFTATSSASTSDGIFDTQLFLFDASGNGLAYNDDIDAIDFFSTIAFTPSESGTYYLGVSGVGLNPRDALGDFLYVRDPFDPSARLGPSPAG